MSATTIEWATDVWNPTTGCSKVSPGCEHCYAETMALRRMQPYDTGLPWTKPNAGQNIALHRDRLDIPLRWRKPRERVFVNSMSDLFHEQIPDWFIDAVFYVMEQATKHNFLVLTKRSARMRSYMRERYPMGRFRDEDTTPPPNVWLIVSAENQRFLDERAQDLLETPAAIRGISAEPLLGPLDFNRFELFALRRGVRIDWVVLGGESGHRARPCNLHWILDGIDQCDSAGVACFVKQVGSRPIVVRNNDASTTWSDVELLAEMKVRHPKGGDPSEWPEELRVRQLPVATGLAAQGVLPERHARGVNEAR